GRWFIDRGVRHALITLAAAGSVLVTADGSTHIAPHRVEVVDTTAAGDAFAGYLAAALAAGQALDHTVDRAEAAAALAVPPRGAAPSLPYAAEVDAMLAAPRTGRSSDDPIGSDRERQSCPIGEAHRRWIVIRPAPCTTSSNASSCAVSRTEHYSPATGCAARISCVDCTSS